MKNIEIVNMEVSMESICRTCMNQESDLISIFESFIADIDSKSLATILMDCTSIQVNKEDGLPSQICNNCVKQLTAAFNFKRLSEEVDVTLREISKNSNIEFVKEEFILDSSDNENTINSEPDQDKNVCSIENESASINMEDFDLSNGMSEDKLVLPEIVYICETCSRMFKTYDSFEDHQLTCCDKSDYICEECDMTLGRDEFIEHQHLHESEIYMEEKLYECKECNITFESKVDQVLHKKIHKKMYKCTICEREFKSKHGLDYHIKIHNDVKKFTCRFENCQKRFAIKQALVKHESVHTKDGNHLCYLCGKMFGTTDSLYYHIKTHEGRRPHLCVHCGKTFKQMCHLKSHMWVHNGVKPHECITCGKCYTSGHQLKKHLKKYCNNFSKTI